MQVSNRNEVNYVQLDWLEFFVEVLDTQIQGFERNVFDGGTNNYKQRIEYVLDGKVVATLVWLPKSKVIRSASGSDQVGNLRIHNHVLYSGRCKELTDRIMNGKDIIFLSLTRIDICSDFNTFANRRQPENLIKDFLNGSIRRKKARGMKDLILNVAKDNNPMAERVEETLYFGNSKNGVSTKLYNKTKELAEKTEKVYIRELWEKCDTIDTEKDVWRLEVSIKAKEFKELATGKVLRLDNSNVFCLETQTKLYLSILAHNFTFVKYDKKKTRIDRMKTIQLFSGVFKAFQKFNKLDDRAN